MKKLISMRSLVIQSYVWLALPVLIFMFGWMRLRIALPVALLICAVLFRIFRSGKDSRYFRSDGFAGGVCRDRTLVMILAALFLVCLLMGLGGFFYQFYFDNGFRNAVEFDLVRRSWPVTYTVDDGAQGILCYYFAFWLPSAIAGKLCGGMIIPADLFTLLYAFWGIALTLCFIFSFVADRRRWLLFLVFILFNAWNAEGIYFRPFEATNAFTSFTESAMAFANRFYSFGNVSYILGLIYNQGVPTLLCCMLLWFQRRNYGILLFTYSLLCLFAPFPVLGIFPCMLVYTLRHLRPSVTWENLTGLVIAALSALFLVSNNIVSSSSGTAEGDGMVIQWLFASLIWFVLAIGVYLPFVWNELKGNFFFWGMWLTVFVYGALVVGGSCDLSWRGAIPLCFMLMVAVMRRVSGIADWRRPGPVCFAVVLAVGGIGTLCMFGTQVRSEIKCLENGQPVKSIYYMGKIHKKEYNPMYGTLIGDKETFYTRFLMPEAGEREATSDGQKNEK